MKTERRHELQHNALADRLAFWIESAEPYSRAILGVVVAIVAITFAVGFVSMRDAEHSDEGWTKFYDAMNARNPLDFDKTAELYSSTKVSQWARLASADILLGDSIDRLLTDRKDAEEYLRRAAEMYHRVITESEDKSPLVPRAKFGLARTRESQGDLTRARELYNAIVSDGGPFAAAAKARAEDLDRPETKDFYDWLAKYQPPASEQPDKKLDFLKDSLQHGSDLGIPPLVGKDSPLSSPSPDAQAPAADAARTTPPAATTTTPAATTTTPAATTTTPAATTTTPDATPQSETPAPEPGAPSPPGESSNGEKPPAPSAPGATLPPTDGAGETGPAQGAAPATGAKEETPAAPVEK